MRYANLFVLIFCVLLLNKGNKKSPTIQTSEHEKSSGTHRNDARPLKRLSEWRGLLFLVRVFLLIVPCPLGIHGEPAFQDALALLEDLEDGPEAGEGDDTKGRGADGVLHKEGEDARDDPSEGKDPPATRPEIILGLDDDGVEETMTRNVDAPMMRPSKLISIDCY